ncbi:Sodium/hydrogen exchanger [Thalictrum thalictroides]|uniref:Sodium/hydrogen exchanger n=1 Tax=Thalictrum thalictroides TaxID=46969 RepID=A0A7J6VQ60_THATH|nr:Sodium/hydrogen exchanger [Thalictrum thalictroides]
MATVLEGPLPFKIIEKEETDTSSDDPVVAIFFFGICLVLGIASRHLLRGTKVPYTVALLVLGIALGSLEYGTSHRLGKVGAGIRLWANINPDLLLAVFLPALLFESSFSMEVHQIKRCMVQMFILAGPGVLISTFFLGSALKLLFPYDWSWETSLLLGGLLSATDPVAIVALLKDLGASKKLSTIIEGESLMNDGTAIVVYQLFYQMVLGRSFTVGAILKYLAQVSLGAVGIGFAFGVASYLWLGFIFNDTVIEITLTLAVSYIAYFAAQDGADVSGVLAVMTLGMFYSSVARTAFKGEGQQSLHHFWEMVAYIANTLIFILSGVVIAEGVLHNKDYFENHGTSWGYLILLYGFVQVSRVIVVGTLYPCLKYFGYGLDWKEATILVWSGLRGAVALSLSLSVKRTSDTSSFLSQDTGTLFVFFTGGIVFLTLIVNGSTTQFILHLLHMDKLSEAKRRILDYTRYEMMNKALDAFGDLGDDEELGPSDWPTVKRYISCLNNLEGEQVHPHSEAVSENNPDAMNLKDIRIRLLNGVQAAYWGMLEEGRISQTSANIMMQSVDAAMDLVSDKVLCDWNGLRAHVHFPSYYRFLKMNFCPQKLVTYFTVERLESACYMCAAFLRAHRIARRQLHDFLGDSEIASLVINESEAEGEEARKFLEDVRVIFPQVLRVVKTRQVTYSILKQLSDYVQNLEKVGLLEKKEVTHLHDSVQTDLKKLLRNPPLVKMPKISDLLRGHPLLGALPAVAREPLEGSTKELLKLHGVAIYKEGSKPNGIWLISNGLVKWTSRSLRNKHSLHPIFSHGSSLGLYEVLIGKPYICNMITDSVVHCFFIEAEKILSLLRSDPTVEGFLWQESVIVVAKLLLPQVYEKMSMQELRALVVERSMMNIYIRGETIDVPSHSVGFLLEGFIKTQEAQEDLIQSPAVLLPPCEDLSFLNLETSGAKAASFCHQGFGYLVEARARVIFFDMAALEGDSVLRKRSASWISHSVDPPRGQSREHSALMSWPELFYMPRRHHQNSEGTGQETNNLSARAMQLSIFGSMVNTIGNRTRSVPRNFYVKEPHSLSYPRVPSRKTSTRPLVSIQSEGSATVGKSLRAREFTGPNYTAPVVAHTSNEMSGVAVDSSDESCDDNDLILTIDSPK